MYIEQSYNLRQLYKMRVTLISEVSVQTHPGDQCLTLRMRLPTLTIDATVDGVLIRSRRWRL